MPKEKNQSKSFEGFTNLYELSKTLRFELKPSDDTQRMLEENQVFGKDELIQKKYEQTKPFFNKLHKEFVKNALSNISLNFDDYFLALKAVKKNTKDTGKKIKDARIKALQDQEKTLRAKIVNLFNDKAKNWAEKKYPSLKLKKKNIDIFFEEGVFLILKEMYAKEAGATLEIIEKDRNGNEIKTGKFISIFDSWKGFTGYFTKFQETRKNFYKGDGTSTAFATRIIDQNLRRFCDNLQIFVKIKSKLDFSEVEKDFGKSMEEVFSLNFYNQCVLQDGINFYNKALGGETLENGKKLKGVNELVNNYRQNNKGKKLPFLKPLDKQILSEKDKFIDEIENDEGLLRTLKTFFKTAEEKTKILKMLFGNFVSNNKNYNLKEIYISKEALNTISYKWTNKTEDFERLLFEAMRSDKPAGLKYEKKDNSYKFPNFVALEYIKTFLENTDVSDKFWKERYYKIKESETVLPREETEKENKNKPLTGEEEVWQQFLLVFNFEFNALFKKESTNKNGEVKEIGYDVIKPDFKQLVEKNELAITPEAKIVIKNFSDNTLWIYQMAKYFAVDKKRTWNPENLELGDFYSNPEFGYEKFYNNAYADIVQTYNLLRNYLTKKPYSEEKCKLNFENSTLADGWDKNKEKNNFAVILRKDGKYYLGIMRKGANDLFDAKHELEFFQHTEQEEYEKMVYKYAKDVSLGIPKSSTQTKEVIAHFLVSDKDYYLEKGSSVGKFIKPLKITKEIFEINNRIYKKEDLSISVLRGQIDKEEEKEHIKMFQKEYVKLGGDIEKYKKSVYKWIEFCKEFLFVYPSSQFFDYSSLKNTKEYESLDEFYSDVDALSYKISFQNIPESYIEEKNKHGELYLFQIKNKDWNLKDGRPKTGTKNLHTLYFENLFSPENIAENFLFKLNGQAEIFYRPKTKKEKLGTKKDKQGREVINHKRYNENKNFFHIPMTLNRGSGKSFSFDREVNCFLANNKEINIIGIDRGEKHLAYYSVITQKGEILENGSLNFVGKGKDGKPIDYHRKLEDRAKDRGQARKDWQDVQAIKDLKKGYISQVVRKLADLAIKHNAIIVFEDLNMRFKQIRGGIEKSVYQQLEKALIEKLNFLVNKGEKDSKKAGHLLSAYQLTAPFTTFKEMGKQTGILFYTQANYTSITDPVSGFRKNLYINNSASIEKIKAEINKFSAIGWDDNLKSYYFKYDAKKFNKHGWAESKEWTVYANIPRIRREKKNGHWGYKAVNPNELLSKLFSKYGIENNKIIKEQIKDKESKNELGEKEFDGQRRNFYKSLIFIFNLILQTRNSFSGQKDNGEEVYTDFIASPVYPFFTTESKYSKPRFEVFEKMFLGKVENKNKILKDFNGDTNGALNIARKGIIILDKINKWHKENEKLKKEGKKEKFYPDLYISYLEWDKFTQK